MTVIQIQKELERLGDKEKAVLLQRYFKTGKGEYAEGDLFRGITVPVLRTVARGYKSLTLSDTEELLHSPFHEDRLLALLILIQTCSKSDAVQSEVCALYLRNTRFINNWDLIDVSAGHIVGRFLLDRDKEPLTRLALSSLLWERRIAIMATGHFIRMVKFDETLRIARLLLSDKEDLIHKAVGWMLREVGKRDFEVEEEFLRRYYRQMPRTMLRYAIEKFPESVRQAYLTGKV